MASITQTIPNYNGGISEQPDDRKGSGVVRNCVNAVPDLVHGLIKRPGAKRISEDKNPISTNKYGTSTIPSGGSWFHYHRDETEGSYIGQVDSTGKTRIWSCNDGSEKNVWYVTDNTIYNAGTAAHAAITTYLTPNPSSDTEDIQALTINDSTFLVNRSKTVGTTGTTPAKPEAYAAYIDLLRAENGRQYSLNVWEPAQTGTTSVAVATRIRLESDTLAEGNGTGTCPGIGTQVFTVNSADSYSSPIVNVTNSSGSAYNAASNKKNLIFRITSVGQQGFSGGGDDANPDNMDYACSYSRNIVLLHGGTGWAEGDKVTVSLTQAKTTYNYTVVIDKVETIAVKGTINSGANGIVRPEPTPWDADTAVTTDTILGGINGALSGTGLSTKIIGNGIYISSSSAFNVEAVNNDIMRVMQSEVNNVAELPNQCRHGYIVKISNSQMSDEDDYYLKFVGENNVDGPGSWVECAKPGIVKSLDAGTMPHILERQADGDFLIKQYTWADREVGDDNTNPVPSFVGNTINKVLFFRNRLSFLSNENVILSRAGQLGNFWSDTALTVSPVDPIDISSASDYPSELFDGIEINTGLLVFSTNQQFLLASDDTVFNPDTVKLRVVGAYNYNKVIPPISLGQTQAFVDNSGKYSKFWELAAVVREGEPVFQEASITIPTTLPRDLDSISVSRENGYVTLGKLNEDILYVYKWQNSGNVQQPRVQSAWFKWKFNNPLRYQCIVNDQLFILDSDNFLQSVNLKQVTSDPSIDQDEINYLLHLDNYTTVSNGSYADSTKKTTFSNQSDWIDDVTTPNGKIEIGDSNSGTKREGRYTECTVINTDDFTVPGNWQYSQEWTFPDSAVNTSNEQITVTAHGLSTEDPVRYQPGNSAIAGLTGNTVYYIIKVDDNTVKLALTSSDAGGGTAINLTNQGSGTHKFQKDITDLNIGYLYDYQVDLPKIYLTKRLSENSTVADAQGSLTIHRIQLNLGKSGLYETTLTRVGKADYTEVYESTDLDEYNVSDAPYLEETTKVIPVYEKNTNVNIQIKSTHPAPAVLKSMAWEGNYSPKFYRRG